MVNSHWVLDVLELLLASILESDIEFAPSVLLHPTRHADATGLCKALHACRHVHAITEDVATVDHYVADIDADAKLDALFLWHVDVALSHAALDINRTTHRVHYAAELSQQPISGVFDDTPA